MSSTKIPMVYYDPDDEYADVEVWASAEDCENDNQDGLLGHLDQQYWFNGVPQFNTQVGFPLALLQRYMLGMQYSIILHVFQVESFVSEAGLFVPAAESLFVPLVSLEHLDEFAKRCAEYGMLR